MRPTKIDRNRVLTLAALFNRRQRDYKSLEQALEDGDLPAAQRALARCREANQQIASATGISSNSAAALLGATLLKADLSVLKQAFESGEIPDALTGGAAQQWYQRALDEEAVDPDERESLFVQSLFSALQATSAKGDYEQEAAAPAEADDEPATMYQLYAKRG